MALINVYSVDETFVRIECDAPYLLELKEHFSFYAKGYNFHPRFKMGLWNGRVSLLNVKERTLYKGLLPDFATWADHNGYSYELSDKVVANLSDWNITDEKVIEFYRKIQGPFAPHDQQVAAVKHCINSGRSIILAPTSSGKSYIIHGITSFYGLQKKRTLVIIDRSQLIEQLRENLRDEYNGPLRYATVYDKKVDPRDVDVYFTTWQSCYENPKKWFENFDVLIGDEVHKFKAASLKAIMDKCGHIAIRHGFTATLDNDSQTDRLTLKGMFGTPYRVATLKELIEQGIVARPTVYAIRLIHPDEDKKKLANAKYKDGTEKYQKEIEFLEDNEVRNRFISDLDKKLKGNTLIVFKHQEHGKKLVELVGDRAFYVDGTVALDTRIEYSKLIDQMHDATAVVSTGTFSTGVNIKNINQMILGCDVQSKITVPQILGRGLRKSERKDTLRFFDLGDDMVWQGRENISFKHFKERLEMYAELGVEIVLKTHRL